MFAHDGVPGVLDVCSGLTSLSIRDGHVQPHDLPRLAALSGLKDLELRAVSYVHPRGLATVPCSAVSALQLTRLALCGAGVKDVHLVSRLTSLSVLCIDGTRGQPVHLAPDIAPNCVLPASLVDIVLGSNVVLAPSVLSAALQLTQLQLSCSCVWQDVVGDAAAVLSALSRLQSLEVLNLDVGRVRVWPPTGPVFQALTASSRLRSLYLCGCTRIPTYVWYAFPPDRIMTSLTSLSLVEDDDGVGDDGLVTRIATCAPGLHDLDMSLGMGLSVTALTNLLSLTRLH